MIGHIWGAADNQLVFTPMQDVFADIKAKARTDNVGLANQPSRSLTPETQAAVKRVTLTCGDESKIERKLRDWKADLSTIPRRPKQIPRSSLLAVSQPTMSNAKPLQALTETTPEQMTKLQLASVKMVRHSVLSNINNQSCRFQEQHIESIPKLFQPLADRRLASPPQLYKLLPRMLSPENPNGIYGVQRSGRASLKAFRVMAKRSQQNRRLLTAF